MLGLLTPQPFRGDQVASGAVVLTTLVALLELRLADDVDAGGRLALAVVVLAFVSTLAVRAPVEPGGPRGYQVALYVCSWALTLIALVNLVEATDGEATARTVFLVAAALTLAGGGWARRRDSSTMTLLAALSGIVTVVAFADWTVDPSAQGVRWLLAGCAVVLGLGAVARRDHRPFHAAQLANAGALAIGAILATALVAPAVGLLFLPGGVTGEGGPELGAGWELVGVGSGFGMVAYGAVDHHRGPVLVGVLLLALWVGVAGAEPGLIGWPLVLAIVAGFLLVVGLRPSTPLPPPPDAAVPPGSLRALPEREPEL